MVASTLLGTEDSILRIMLGSTIKMSIIGIAQSTMSTVSSYIASSFQMLASISELQTKRWKNTRETQRDRKAIFLNTTSLLSIILSTTICVKAFTYQPTERQCDDSSYVWSPASDHISYSWSTEYVDLGTYTPYFDVSYKDVVEDAWDQIMPSMCYSNLKKCANDWLLLLEHPISIPTSKLPELNQSTPADSSSWIRDPNDQDSILALPQVFVDLGCLNFLRQWSSKFDDHDYSNLKSFQGGQKLVDDRAHQCLERLRHSITCWGDTTVILEFIDEPWTKVDFGTLHYCRDFEEIRQWTKESAVRHVTLDNLWWGGIAWNNLYHEHS